MSAVAAYLLGLTVGVVGMYVTSTRPSYQLLWKYKRTLEMSVALTESLSKVLRQYLDEKNEGVPVWADREAEVAEIGNARFVPAADLPMELGIEVPFEDFLAGRGACAKDVGKALAIPNIRELTDFCPELDEHCDICGEPLSVSGSRGNICRTCWIQEVSD